MKLYDVKIVGYRSYLSKKDGKKRFIWFFVSVDEDVSEYSDGYFTGTIFMSDAPCIGEIYSVLQNNGYWQIIDLDKLRK